MKVLQKLIFTVAMVVGLTFAVSAQKDDKKPPPKGAPPVVTPQPKNPPPQKPPKKPSDVLVYWKSNSGETI